MRRLVLGTAGHIDHGKTALIRSLTGIDTDRLEEEKARGISIDLGFAHMEVGGSGIGIVDVPGHEKFVKNMLAGIGGIDMVLFVVASDEGIMPQTREHFDIVRLLGIERGVFALTKTDLVEPDMVELVREEVAGLVEGTPLESAAVIPTSTRSGEGVEDVRKALAELAGRIAERRIGEAVRMPVDRVFSMTGRGTVVTGTLWSGSVEREDRLVLMPGNKPVRVRSVEVHGREVDRAMAGQRTALGLHGVERKELGRGWTLVSPGDFESTMMLDAVLDVLESARRPVKTRRRIRFHLGASEVMGRVHVLGAGEILPGRRGFVQVRLETPVTAGFGDRFVVRSYSPMRTIGGGRVLDPLPPKHRRREGELGPWFAVLAGGDLKQAMAAHIRRAPQGLRLDSLRTRLNCGATTLEAAAAGLAESGLIVETSPGLYLHREALETMAGEITRLLETYQKTNRLTWGMPKEELRERLGSVESGFLNWILERLQKDGRVFSRKGMVRAGSGEVDLSPREKEAARRIVDLLAAEPFKPPSERDLEAAVDLPASAVRKVLRLLLEDGEVVRLEPGLVMHDSAVDTAKDKIRAYLAEHGEATASDLKGVLGTTRKYAVPLLELLDRMGVTRRRGNSRVLGPSS
jgi:selenocysteine-specific elongation factor